MPDSRTLHWRRNSNQIASGKPGAVHFAAHGLSGWQNHPIAFFTWTRARGRIGHPVVDDWNKSPGSAPKAERFLIQLAAQKFTVAAKRAPPGPPRARRVVDMGDVGGS
jgi:hypothetical protein